jgi:hypothetical protein
MFRADLARMSTNTSRDHAADFNALAVANAWPTRIDSTMSFQSKELRAMRDLWNSVAAENSLPSRSQFTARHLKPYLPDLDLVGIEAEAGRARRYRHRYVGTHVVAVLGEMTGQAFEDFMPPETSARTIACFDAVVAGCRPTRVLTRFQLPKADYLAAEIFGAPLAEDGVTPNMILTVFHIASPTERESEAWRLDRPGSVS